ncbi:lipid IV(A) 3-deoxy-D-manno-octulosonic acid transferase [Blochmannia endosymbiont of Polyrhachis (Hedomyrma) turneri]|uniref:lipid IV(A) 3-deoxy-D-manno-octulosonic acid transferase n=1 Tax=Blochmannia endosymbiont of Polyrhachis (Hedomyrma) turneri TaxID=1505596 RepID=UPI00061A86C2|nr:lipid IV(A) 3-deoxy-D-manno-octulosonic acid transferase [Blochmannia endosymbiont of Polyrhachis (Hedomyrma) turneri]AKC60163.1 3-deoxy-D-manno-octulosonic-acid transferase [Blochmannia endosymbiont of Polyrhachis (Hedomyrma) turneri]
MLYYIIYNTIIYLIQPIILIRLLWRSINIPAYRKTWNERYGFYNTIIQPRGIILHAVSVGETLAAIPLIHALQKKYPSLNIMLTSMTPSGKEVAQSILGNTINYGYLPYDLPGAIRRFIHHTQPILVITLETELWPNLIKILYKYHIPYIIANARLSSQSANNYKKIKKFITLIMQYVTLIAAQNKKDAERFISLGLQNKKIAITGNIKFDVPINNNLLKKSQTLKKLWANNRYVWIASSTHKGEETLLLQVHENLLKKIPNLLMILAPRHKERFISVHKIITKTKLRFITRSSGQNPTYNTQVIIIDTIGELTLLYGVADLAFIGGSLIKHGGHNPIEAAAHGIPILTGPYVFNFHAIYNIMIKAKASIKITNITSLENKIYTLLTNQTYRLYYGKNATHVLRTNQGAIKKLLPLLDHYILTNDKLSTYQHIKKNKYSTNVS